MTELDLVEDVLRVGSTALSLLRPRDAEALLDEDAFADDEFLPYWAELWPAGLALARALPSRLDGVPALVAAARSAQVTATDWASEAIDLLRVNAARNGLALEARIVDWRHLDGDFDLALAADVLYEHRNIEPL